MVRSKKATGQEPETTKRVAYTVKEAAKMFGRSRGTINAWVKTGVLREMKVPGGLAMVTARSVDDLLAGRARLKAKAKASKEDA
jgi:excisionase family DNA binding protein